jgi:DNA-binding SARP family transcriptional activator
MLGEVRPFVMRECCMKVYFYPDGDIFQWVQESRDIFVENFIKQELLSMVDLSIK